MSHLFVLLITSFSSVKVDVIRINSLTDRSVTFLVSWQGTGKTLTTLNIFVVDCYIFFQYTLSCYSCLTLIIHENIYSVINTYVSTSKLASISQSMFQE
jgi:hypothetical protein